MKTFQTVQGLSWILITIKHDNFEPIFQTPSANMGHPGELFDFAGGAGCDQVPLDPLGWYFLLGFFVSLSYYHEVQSNAVTILIYILNLLI